MITLTLEETNKVLSVLGDIPAKYSYEAINLLITKLDAANATKNNDNTRNTDNQ